jgi:ABC-2 type transport system permease protein
VALEATAPSGDTGVTDGPGVRRVEERSLTTRVVSSHVTVPRRLSDVWRARQLLVNLVRTDIRVKYKNSVLGLLWSLLAPAMTLIVYAVVFGLALKNGYPNFVILLFSGLLVWNLFQTAVLTATPSIVLNAGLVKKVSFPREILALSAVGSASIFFLFQGAVLILFLFVLHWAPDWKLLWLLPVALVPLVVFCSAMAIFLAAINVYLRDTQHLIEVVVGSAWFWACPIVYSYQKVVVPGLAAHGIPQWVYFLNPLTPMVLTFERVIYAKEWVHLTLPGAPYTQLLPSWGAITYVELNALVLVASLVFLWIAMVVFGRLAGNFAEEL